MKGPSGSGELVGTSRSDLRFVPARLRSPGSPGIRFKPSHSADMSTPRTVASHWTPVGAVPPTALNDARLEVHHAVQIAVSAAISYLPARADDSHTALTWSAQLRALVTATITAPRPFRIALKPRDLTLTALADGAHPPALFNLPGATIASANEWLTQVASEAGLDARRFTRAKHYTIAHYAVADGAQFSTPGVEFAELERYWSNAADVLEGIAAETEGAGPVLVWPHHFDIATLISLPLSTAGRRTIGVGHSPGDEWYPEPYWYVAPNPPPATTKLPPLDGGHWHTQGWVGAALPASEYVDRDAPGQQLHVRAFVDSAIRGCRLLLG